MMLSTYYCSERKRLLVMVPSIAGDSGHYLISVDTDLGCFEVVMVPAGELRHQFRARGRRQFSHSDVEVMRNTVSKARSYMAYVEPHGLHGNA